ncbi:hypothetical protein [Streptomyces sp. NPDC096339]|uniref:hypothetical protein n=1 Tax=Streptomyces sp. NPDC096339 TaxID=3366086 RepID=UPI00380941DB
MATRPSDSWRALMAEMLRDVAAGTLDAECACPDLFPESFLQATDAALAAFERDMRSLNMPSDEAVLGAVEKVVLALNAVDADGRHGSAGYCTIEREELCDYIDLTLNEHGVDVMALSSRQGIGEAGITDQWRDW